MRYVIKRTARGTTYVARHSHGYTVRLEEARVWETREAARLHCVGNEMVVALYEDEKEPDADH